MGHLLVPIHGGFTQTQPDEVTPYGHDLRWEWDGCEIGFLQHFPEVLAAVSEAEMRDWIIGVHYPLIDQGRWAPFWFDPDPAGRANALADAAQACGDAGTIGARYILFHYPWPALLDGRDYAAMGWRVPSQAPPLVDWSRERLRDVSRRVFESLAEAAAKRHIQVILEADGPNPHFFDPSGENDLFAELFRDYPDLQLCVDTGRLDLLARTHGGDPLAYTQRWLPFAKHLHLHGATRTPHQGHLPPLPEHDGDPAYAPAAEMARRILAAHPQACTVLETDPRALSPAEVRRSFDYCRQLVQGARA